MMACKTMAYAANAPYMAKTRFPFPVVSVSGTRSVSVPCVAEETGDYHARAIDDTGFPAALRSIEVGALRHTADAQIGRLLRLANLLDNPVAVDRPAEDLALYATDIRQATILLEQAIHALADAPHSKAPGQ